MTWSSNIDLGSSLLSVEGNETGFLTYVERDVYDPVWADTEVVTFSVLHLSKFIRRQKSNAILVRQPD